MTQASEVPVSDVEIDRFDDDEAAALADGLMPTEARRKALAAFLAPRIAAARKEERAKVQAELIGPSYVCQDCGHGYEAAEDGNEDCPKCAAVLARMAGPNEVVVPGWQARDTAPKDGTRFLACFVTGQVAIIKRHDVGGRYEAWVTDGQYPNLPAFTHWMPLPDIATRPQGGNDDAAAIRALGDK